MLKKEIQHFLLPSKEVDNNINRALNMEGKIGNPENTQYAFPTRFLYRTIESLIEDNNLFDT